MPNQFVYADEAGCFSFARISPASRYFIICTISMETCNVGDDLQRLHRDMVGMPHLRDYFHASHDRQSIRDCVFAALMPHDFQVQAAIIEKSKVHPKMRVSQPQFYGRAYFYHFKHAILPLLEAEDTEVLVTTASLGTRREKPPSATLSRRPCGEPATA